jgi:hypothetical protein
VYYSAGRAAHAPFDEAARAGDGRFSPPTKPPFDTTKMQLIIVKQQEIAVLERLTSIKNQGTIRKEFAPSLGKSAAGMA